MKISILTLFPEMFAGPFDYSIIKRAKEKKLLNIELINIRDFGLGKHKTVDDKPFGGGAGMVLKVDVVVNAVESAKCGKKIKCKEKIILLSPSGKVFNQQKAKQLSKIDHLILVCGHYEGVDERIKKFISEEISIGDYVLTGGEIPAMVLTDAICRLLPEVLGKDESSVYESFQEIMPDKKKVKVLEYPQYTRPQNFRELKVPRILLSGNHKKISSWRTEQAIKITAKKRPDLLK